MVNMNSDRKKKNLKGVVLIMVVTVMMVLIVMLLATLAAVSTAQSRYYSKYEENQAYYSARSALEVVQQCQFTDSEYIAYDTSGSKRYETGYDKEGNLVTMEMTQGLGMQFALARLKAHSDTMDNYYAMTDKTQFSDDFWANPGIDGNTVFDDASCTATAYYENPDKEYIEFKVRFPAVSNGSEKFGGFVDQEDPTDPDTQIATIRFEVLARTYDGHDPKLQDKINANPGMASSLIASDIDDIKKGDRSKDKTYYKATVFTECQGTQQSASVVYYPKERNEEFNSAVTAVGFIGGVDNGIVIDGYSTPEDLPLGNMGVYVGESYVGGEVTTPGGGSAFAMSKGQVTYIKTLASVTNNFYPIALGLTDTSDYSDVPLVFVDGDANFYNQIIWAKGSSSTRANQVDLVIMGDMTANNDLSSNGNFMVNGDVHLNCNNISFSTDTRLIINGDLYIESQNISIPANTIYVLGDVYFSFSSVQPNRFQELFLTVGALVDINGVTCEAKSSGVVQDGLSNDYFSYKTLTGDPDAFGHLDTTSDLVQTDEGAEIFLPSVTTITPNDARVEDNSGDANYSRMVPCFTSKYESFWKRDTNGNYIMNGAEHVYVSAEEYAGSTSSDREAGMYTEKSFDAPADSDYITNGEITVVGESNYIMTPGYYDVHITGGGTANIYVQDGYYRGTILSDDETFVNFYFNTGNYTWIMANYNQTVYDGFSTGLRFGKKATIPVISAPKIYFYASSGAIIDATEAGKCLFTGYIYAPEATINTVKGLDGSYTYYYNDDVVVNNDGTPMNCPPIIIGSVFCNDISVSQNSATCFVPPIEYRSIGQPLYENTERWYYIDQ